MAGLFSNDQDILSNIIKERQAANTALGSPYGKYAGIVSTGASLADRAADAMSAGMLGGSDPRMQQQQEIKKIFSDVATQTGSTSSP